MKLVRIDVLLLTAAIGTAAFGLGGCVPQARYDAALKDAQSAHADTTKQAADDQAKIAAIQKQLDDVNAELRSELQGLGKNVDKLLADKGTLSSALDQAKNRLDELRKAQAAADSR